MFSENLKKKGFFFNAIDTIIQHDSIYHYKFNLNQKIDSITIELPKNSSPKTIVIPITNIEPYLNKKTKELDKQGFTFSKVSLNNIHLNTNKLYASLNINTSNKRYVDTVLIKGYNNFPKAFIKHFFKIKENTIYNKDLLTTISTNFKSLDFASEIKPSDVLFSNDSTLIYLYIKKNRTNSFDGLLGFNSNDDGALIFNGHIDLQLNNLLNTGETFNLNWQANGETSQNIIINTRMPFIFKSPISTDLTFELFKQDSSFINSKFQTDLIYNLSAKTSAFLNFETTTSNTTTNTQTDLTDNLNSKFFGLGLIYQKQTDTVFNTKDLFLNVSAKFGQREHHNKNQNQFKFQTEASYLYALNAKHALYIRNRTDILNSPNYYENELFRIGGINTIRGVANQSIYTPNHSTFNLEYHFLVSNTSYIYSITDIAFIKDISSTPKNMSNLGLGYKLKLKNSLLNIFYVSTSATNELFRLNNPSLNLSVQTFF